MLKKQNCVIWIQLEKPFPLPKGKNEKVIGSMKDELNGKIVTKFVRLRSKAYSYLIDDGSEDKKAKDTKKCIIKRKLKFEIYKNCLEATQLPKKISHLEKRKIIMTVLKKVIKNSQEVINQY